MPVIPSKIRGVTYPDPFTGESRQTIIKKWVRPGMELIPSLEPDNPHGANAVALWFYRPKPEGGSVTHHLGYIGSDLSWQIAPWLRDGYRIGITVTEITGGNKESPTRGVNIALEVPDAPTEPATSPPTQSLQAHAPSATKTKTRWGRLILILAGFFALLCGACYLLSLLPQ